MSTDTTVDEAKGRVKEAAGDLTDDQDLKDEGKVDQIASDVKDKVDGLKGKVDDVADKVKDKVSGEDS